MRGRGIRGRLVLVVMGVVGIGLVLLVVAFNLILSDRLDNDIDAVLSARANGQMSALDVRDGKLIVTDIPDEATAESQAWIFAGKRVLAAPRSPHQRVDSAAEGLAAGPRRYQDVESPADRMLAEPIIDEGRRVGTVVVAASRTPYESTRKTALIASIVLAALLIVVLGVVARLLLDAALRPVARMTESAAEWSEKDLDRRFNLGPPSDELTLLAATLDALLDRLAAGMRREQRFSAELSHELRTPLAKISTQAQLLSSSPDLGSEQHEEAAAILRAAEEMREVIEVLMASARAEAGIVGRDTADVETAARASLEAARPDAEERGVAFELVPGNGAGAMRATAEPKLVERILAPLVENAGRHARSRATVHIVRNGPWLEVAVEDDGPGVPAGQEATIFEPGFRGEEAGNANHGGAGLGLSLARPPPRPPGGGGGAGAPAGGGGWACPWRAGSRAPRAATWRRTRAPRADGSSSACRPPDAFNPPTSAPGTIAGHAGVAATAHRALDPGRGDRRDPAAGALERRAPRARRGRRGVDRACVARGGPLPVWALLPRPPPAAAGAIQARRPRSGGHPRARRRGGGAARDHVDAPRRPYRRPRGRAVGSGRGRRARLVVPAALGVPPRRAARGRPVVGVGAGAALRLGAGAAQIAALRRRGCSRRDRAAREAVVRGRAGGRRGGASSGQGARRLVARDRAPRRRIRRGGGGGVPRAGRLGPGHGRDCARRLVRDVRLPARLGLGAGQARPRDAPLVARVAVVRIGARACAGPHGRRHRPPSRAAARDDHVRRLDGRCRGRHPARRELLAALPDRARRGRRGGSGCARPAPQGHRRGGGRRDRVRDRQPRDRRRHPRHRGQLPARRTDARQLHPRPLAAR